MRTMIKTLVLSRPLHAEGRIGSASARLREVHIISRSAMHSSRSERASVEADRITPHHNKSITLPILNPQSTVERASAAGELRCMPIRLSAELRCVTAVHHHPGLAAQHTQRVVFLRRLKR